MKLKNLKLNTFNVAVVFDNFTSGNISFDEIKNTFGKEVSLHEVPNGLLLIVFNDEPIQCQIGQRRLLINYNNNEEIIDLKKTSKRVKEILYKLNDMIKYDNVKINAFGFNYDGAAVINKKVDAEKYFLDKFISKQEKFEKNIEGKFVGLRPSFSMEKDNKLLNFNFKNNKDQNNKFDFHVNIHHNDENIFEKEVVNEIINDYTLIKELFYDL